MKELQYMVDFSLPEILSKDFMDEIPFQRATVNRLFREGVLVNYALSLEKSKMWAIIKADSVTEVLEAIDELPLTRFMQVDVSPLTFFNTLNEKLPIFSMN